MIEQVQRGRCAVPAQRGYRQACGVARGLDIVGERWSLLVVRELLLGPKRFTDLRAGMPGASPDVLAQRLRDLTEAGVVRQHKLPPPVGAQVYALTEWGAELEPVVTHLGRWGSRSPSMPYDADRSIDSLVLSMKALFDGSAADGFRATISLRLGDDRFSIDISDRELRLTRGEPERPTATMETDPGTLAALLYGGRPLDEAVRAGSVTIGGATAAVARLLELFPLPEPAVD
jgi:DNA-binding HxlR family transcriptional regulator